ncbi:P-loop containing nucleoside triphosphate hydrolase protein [Mortierella sp. GBAus27b]|nr:Elongation factor 2 [Mortierella sp. GBA43]KAI8345987.1 P-loop containing nucleoside triphosphate hydrolase protein [Mortierella sp. GBAus27b]
MANDIRSLMGNTKNVRNICIIGEQQHGKSALVNYLRSGQEVVTTTASSSGSSHSAKNNDGEQDPVTITKPTTYSLYLKMPEKEESDTSQETTVKPSCAETSQGSSHEADQPLHSSQDDGFLINLLDPPGDTDLLSETSAALRLCDGAMVVIDSVEGISNQTEALLRQASIERIKPVLVLNKLDRVILATSCSKEELYQSLSGLVDNVNAIIATNNDGSFGDSQVDVRKGSVAFGSGLDGWAFTVPQFGAIYAKRFKVDQEKLTKRLWGDYYFNPTLKKWTRKKVDANGEPLGRGFNMFVLEPIYRVFDVVFNKTKNDVMALMSKISVQLTLEEQELEGRQLFKVIMNKFLPADRPLLEMAVLHLPSPITAQQYRANVLHEGPLSDECTNAIRTCDPNGPLVLHVSRMLQTSKKGRFFALGRVFSGTIQKGLKVNIIGPDYILSRKNDLFVKDVDEIVHMTGPHANCIESCSAGNIVGLVGMDGFLLRSGTITTLKATPDLKAIVLPRTQMPIVQATVTCKDSADLPKLVKAFEYLSKAYPSSHFFTTEAGDHVIGGSCETNVRECVKELEKEFPEVPISESKPYSQYRETVTAESSVTVLTKSPNKHNRIFMRAAPLGEELTQALESRKVKVNVDFKDRARVLSEEYGWDNSEARKIWSFGPHGNSANVLVDMTKGVSYLNEIKDGSVLAFQWATRGGVYAEEEVRGCRYNIMDVVMFSDAIHRGNGQIVPAIRRAMFGSTMMAEPRLMEPVYLAEVRFPTSAEGAVFKVLAARDSQLVSEKECPGYIVKYTKIKALIRVPESFGISWDLWKATNGRSTVQLLFDHWKTRPLGMDHPNTQQLILDTRKRKGLKVEMPHLETYLDRL